MDQHQHGKFVRNCPQRWGKNPTIATLFNKMCVSSHMLVPGATVNLAAPRILVHPNQHPPEAGAMWLKIGEATRRMVETNKPRMQFPSKHLEWLHV